MHADSTALYSYFWLVVMVSLLQWVVVVLSLGISFCLLDTSFIWLVTYSYICLGLILMWLMLGLLVVLLSLVSFILSSISV